MKRVFLTIYILALLHCAAYGADAAVIKYIELARKFPENFKIRKILKKLERVENFKKFQKKTVLYDCVDLPALPFPKRSPFSFLFFRKKRSTEKVVTILHFQEGF